ncbi:MAG: hypothetical protein BAJATHORv1_10326 [Candidatus Thorarchaeota archaeon]|nr:MAG: hypothetical protein BAJATHORv1_10326 [Candidatus Thorarchaeota archaeon]
MSQSITIEPGSLQKCDDIARIYNAVSSRDNPDHVDIDGEYYRSAYQSPRVNVERDVILARLKGVGIVGYGTAFRASEQNIPISRTSLKVHPEYTGLGVGSRLFQEIMKIAKAQKSRKAICNIPDFRPSALEFAQRREMRPTKYWIKMSHLDIRTVKLEEKTSDLVIKEIHPVADAERWANLQNEIFQDRIGYTPVTPEFLTNFSQNDRFVSEFALFGISNGEPVVYVMGTKLSSSSNEEIRLLIEGIGTLKEHRRKRYGKSILHELFRRAKSKGIYRSDLVVDNEEEAARQFYLCLGYEERYRRIRYEINL